MTVRGVGLYRPTWGTETVREVGHDEDVVTLAVAAGLLLEDLGDVRRVVVVSPSPDILEGFGAAVVLAGLALHDDVPVELRVGGGAATLGAISEAKDATLVIGVDTVSPAGAGAVLIGPDGVKVEDGGMVVRSLPMRVQHLGMRGASTYDDARLERERGWAPALQRLLPEGSTAGSDTVPTAIVGPSPKETSRLGSDVAVPTRGASAPLFALAELLDKPGARIVALESATAALAVVGEGTTPRVRRSDRPAVAVDARPRRAAGDEADIPFSLPAYERAFVAKTGLLAGHCPCGAVDFPPRRYCSGCGAHASQELRPLARTGEVYTGVAVHVPVPGVPGPYAVAIAQVDDAPVRVLAHVTDSRAADPVIGSRGRLVLRRVATREGVPDYGFGWQPEVEIDPEMTTESEVAR